MNSRATVPETLVKLLLERIKQAYAIKESVEDQEALGSLERYVVINAIDHHWQEHLTEMEDLRKSIGLRSYGQKDPLVEYKSEAYRFLRGADEQRAPPKLQPGLFRSASNLETSRTCSRCSVAPRKPSARRRARAGRSAIADLDDGHEQRPKRGACARAGNCFAHHPIRRETPKVGRNDPCPCRQREKVQAVPRQVVLRPEVGACLQAIRRVFWFSNLQTIACKRAPTFKPCLAIPARGHAALRRGRVSIPMRNIF